ncbi:MAG: SAF domain-containing protein [Actinomycetota bacterium]
MHGPPPPDVTRSGGRTRTIDRRLPRRATWPAARPLLGGLLVALAALVAFVASRPAEGGIEVLVAADDLPAGAVVGLDDLAVAEVDGPTALTDRLVTDADGVLGATLRSDVAANEPLLRSAIDDAVDDGPAFELALDLDVAQAVGARLRPGDRVLVVAETDDDTVVQLGPALVTSLSTPTEGIGGGSLVVVLGVDDGTLAAELAGLRDVDVRLVRIGAAATP